MADGTKRSRWSDLSRAFSIVTTPVEAPPPPSQAPSGAAAPRGAAADAGAATLTLPDGRAVELPVMRDRQGALFLDVRKLHAQTGVCTYDNGFGSTASCMSQITYIDGLAGKLYYRGVPIEQLAEKGDFADTMFLLLDGELPCAVEKATFLAQLKRESMIHEQMLNVFKAFKHDAHPMSIMCTAVAALSSYYPLGGTSTRDPAEQGLAAMRLIAKIPTLAAIAYKTSVGEPIVYPRHDLEYVPNFLHMMFSTPVQPYDANPVVARAIEAFFILHADHEQNASTSTVRISGSSQASPYACLSSGIASLWGPAHGGANEAVVRMLEDIGTVDRIPEFVARAKDKSDPFRLMGFGHRVYRNFDPRSRIMRTMCHSVLEQLGTKDPLLEVAMALEDIALSDDYFVSRNLYPNVDFYSGIVLRAVGFPVSMYTVLFAVARSVGWVAQWKEMASEAVPRICRPRQVYLGEDRRDFVPLEERPCLATARTASGHLIQSA